MKLKLNSLENFVSSLVSSLESKSCTNKNYLKTDEGQLRKLSHGNVVASQAGSCTCYVTISVQGKRLCLRSRRINMALFAP